MCCFFLGPAPALFGNPAATSTTAPGATGTGTSATGASYATAPGATSTTALAAATTATTAPATLATTAPPLLPPSVLKGKTLEEIVDSWGTDLEKQAGEFKRIAGEVQEWDRVLMDNGNQVRNAERPDALAVLTYLYPHRKDRHALCPRPSSGEDPKRR